MKQLSTTPRYRSLLLALFALGFVLSASAEDNRSALMTPRAAASDEAPASLTGKERLGRKWMDEQRVDNCNVPADKRGTKLRPSDCARVSTGTTAARGR